METELVPVFSAYYDDFMLLWPKFLMALLVFSVFFGFGYGSRLLIRRRIKTRDNASIVATFFSELIFWSAVLLGSFSALQTLGFSGLANSLVAGAGVSAIIFGFAFKDILENFLAGILLTIQKPFKTGDIIQVDGYKGPVKALELRSTHIRLADGRDIWIPNAKMVKSVLTNFTRNGLLRHDFAVSLAHDDDTEHARNAILDFLILQESILKTPAPNVIIEELENTGVKLRVMFWIDQLSRQNKPDPIARGESIRSQMIRGVKESLKANGFQRPTTLLEHKNFEAGSSSPPNHLSSPSTPSK